MRFNELISGNTIGSCHKSIWWRPAINKAHEIKRRSKSRRSPDIIIEKTEDYRKWWYAMTVPK
jgi:hypothetical protein